jgi:hypothetical protein
MRHICPDDISSLAEQILEILPLTLKRELELKEEKRNKIRVRSIVLLLSKSSRTDIL